MVQLIAVVGNREIHADWALQVAAPTTMPEGRPALAGRGEENTSLHSAVKRSDGAELVQLGLAGGGDRLLSIRTMPHE